MLKEEDDPFINVELKALKPDWKMKRGAKERPI